MATLKPLHDAQRQSYEDIDGGNTRQVVSDKEASTKLTGVGGLLHGVFYDSFSVAYPTTTSEVYSFFSGGLAGTLVATITLTYTAANKNEISTAVKT